ncbi:hypothetical protein B0H14DRAFT_3878908 [Mycena olivaceomarginata]|nr:hypothetical protein B0H14DRAFT_3878908 [Mycena olivaceomarginata]
MSSKRAASASTIRPPSRSTDAAAPPITTRIDRWSRTSVRRGTLDQSTRNRCRFRTRGYDALLMHLDNALALKPARCNRAGSPQFRSHRILLVIDSDAAASFPRIPYQRLGVELEHPNPHPLSLARWKARKGDILVITLRTGIDVLVAGRVLHVLAPAPHPSRRVPMLLRSLQIPRLCAGIRGKLQHPQLPPFAYPMGYIRRAPHGFLESSTRAPHQRDFLDQRRAPSPLRSRSRCTSASSSRWGTSEGEACRPADDLEIIAMVEYRRRRECPGAGRLKAKGSRHMLDEGCVKMLLSSGPTAAGPPVV